MFGYINMTRAFYAAMKERNGGVIINILGVAGERLEPNYIAGSVGNAGLMAFTKAMGAASPADNIRVVGMNPGPIATERLEDVMRSGRRTGWVTPSNGAICTSRYRSAAPASPKK